MASLWIVAKFDISFMASFILAQMASFILTKMAIKYERIKGELVFCCLLQSYHFRFLLLPVLGWMSFSPSILPACHFSRSLLFLIRLLISSCLCRVFYCLSTPRYTFCHLTRCSNRNRVFCLCGIRLRSGGHPPSCRCLSHAFCCSASLPRTACHRPRHKPRFL